MRVLFLTLLLTAVTSSCLTEAKDPAQADSTAAPAVSAPPGDRATGLTTYASDCAVCHDPVESSAKAGATFARILGAGNVAAHAGVTPWPDEQSSANLAAALAPPAAPADAANGATLYASLCAVCHQPLATTQKPGRTADAISNSQGIAPHSGVDWPTAAQAADIAAALAP